MTSHFIRDKGTIFFRNIPAHVRDMYHLCCMKRRRTMKQEFIRFMRAYVARYNTLLVGKGNPDDLEPVLKIMDKGPKKKRNKGRK